jgi:hypothetical protein
MADIDWPAHLEPEQATIGMRSANLQHRSPYGGASQTWDMLGDRMVLSLTMPGASLLDALHYAGEIESLLWRLTARGDRVRCWHFARPEPLGTLRGAPLLQVGASTGTAALVLATGQPGATLLAGDMIGVGSQLFMAAANATAAGDGLMTVQTVQRARKTIAGGTPVVWQRPRALFVAGGASADVHYAERWQDGAAVELIEDWDDA